MQWNETWNLYVPFHPKTYEMKFHSIASNRKEHICPCHFLVALLLLSLFLLLPSLLTTSHFHSSSLIMANKQKLSLELTVCYWDERNCRGENRKENKAIGERTKQSIGTISTGFCDLKGNRDGRRRASS